MFDNKKRELADIATEETMRILANSVKEDMSTRGLSPDEERLIKLKLHYVLTSHTFRVLFAQAEYIGVSPLPDAHIVDMESATDVQAIMDECDRINERSSALREQIHEVMSAAWREYKATGLVTNNAQRMTIEYLRKQKDGSNASS